MAMVIWYLIERACFSLISAFSRSPTICCGSCCRFTERATLTGSYTHAFRETRTGTNRTPGFGQETTLFMDQHEVSMGVSWEF
ncbi:hypothetical protein [Paracoccus thiocyanatus]|uniref:hypothetical protein n=1 Tax=Paracoccus thiocyanatus TaxID=34006 RepID=UPI001CB6BB76|nr:hypothetical protein [Paracoccus thiocyanatus]